MARKPAVPAGAQSKLAKAVRKVLKLGDDAKVPTHKQMTPAQRQVVRDGGPYTVVVPRSKYPGSAAHIDDATRAGTPNGGPIDRAGAAARRREKLADTPTRTGHDRDEFPPAVVDAGDGGHSVRHVVSPDNRGAGSVIGHQIKYLPDGTVVIIVSGP